MYAIESGPHPSGRAMSCRAFIISKMQDSLLRVPGVGTAIVFGSPYAMRVWLDPYKLHNYNLQPSDVRNAIQAQNIQVSAGSIGAQPAIAGQALNASVTAQSQLQTPEQFQRIIVKSSRDGAVVHLSDVARVDSVQNRQLRHCRTNEWPSRGRHRHRAGAWDQRPDPGGCDQGPGPGAGAVFPARLQGWSFPYRQLPSSSRLSSPRAWSRPYGPKRIALVILVDVHLSAGNSAHHL